jgi:hypothetical protein
MSSIPELANFFQSSSGRLILVAFVAGYIYLLYLRKEHQSKFELKQLDILALSGLFGFFFYTIAIFLTQPLQATTSFSLSSKFLLVQYAAVLATLVSLSGISSLNKILLDDKNLLSAIGDPSSWAVWSLVTVLISILYSVLILILVLIGYLGPASQFGENLYRLWAGTFLLSLMFSFLAVYAWEWLGIITVELFDISTNEQRAGVRCIRWIVEKIEASKWHSYAARIAYICLFLFTFASIEAENLQFKEILIPLFFAGALLPVASLIGNLIGEYLTELGHFPITEND